MSTTTPYPVDSTFHPCCHAIGRHAADCTTATVDSIPLPAGAVDAEPWEIHSGDRCIRFFRGTSRAAGSVRVRIAGEQEYRGGVLSRDIVIDPGRGDDIEMDAAGARQIAAHLLAAADELEAANELDGTGLGTVPTADILTELHNRGLTDTEIAATIGVATGELAALST